MDGTIGELLKHGDPDTNTQTHTHTLKGENLGIKGMINYEATSEVCLCMCDFYICAHTCTRLRSCVCVKCASAYALPAVWQESSVSIILVTVVSGKNSVTVSVQSVLGDVSIRLGRLIPVQLHRRCVYYQMSGP